MGRAKVVSLVRVSTMGQADDEKDGLPGQRRDIDALCHRDKHNLEIVEEFKLTGVSGAYVEKSPEFQRMLNRIKEPGIAGLVFSRMSRFFRPGKLSDYAIFKTFEEYGKLMYCDLGALDQNKSEDKIRINLYGMVAGLQREHDKKQMQDGKNASRKNANRKSDPLPSFVEFVETDGKGNGEFKYLLNEESVPPGKVCGEKVQDAFRRILDGDTLLATSRELGFATHRSLRIVLENPWCYGYKNAMNKRDYGRKRDVDKNGRLKDARRRVRRDEPILTRTNLADTPLVSKATFDRVQALLNSNHKTWTQKKSRQNEFLAVGLLQCGCGERMYAKKGSFYRSKTTGERSSRKPDYYICSTSANGRKRCAFPTINQIQGDEAVVMSAMTWFGEKEFIAAKLAQGQDKDSIKEAKRQIDTIEKTVSKLQKRLANAVEMSLDDPALYKPHVEKFKRELAAAQLELDNLKAELSVQLTDQQIETAADRLVRAFNRFPTLSCEKQKEILREHVSRITIDEINKPHIRYKAEFVVRIGQPAPAFASPASKRESILETVGNEAEIVDA